MNSIEIAYAEQEHAWNRNVPNLFYVLNLAMVSCNMQLAHDIIVYYYYIWHDFQNKFENLMTHLIALLSVDQNLCFTYIFL